MSFKSYSSKRAAQKGAERAGMHLDVVEQVDGAWGYYTVAETPQEGGVEATSQESDAPTMPDSIVHDDPAPGVPVPAGWDVAETSVEPPQSDEEPAAPETDEQRAQRELDEQVAAGTLVRNDDGSYSMPQLAPSLQPAAVAQTAPTRKVQKDRPTQNGVTRPSAGGKCARVWEDCDSIVAAGGVPTPATVKAMSLARGESETNAQIELYQWRKFNGITGRVAAPAATPAPVATTEPAAT